ncbi:MAG: hypothetical protein IT582_04670 [Opitutaceae bacterium]|nr:hypothetical protein [Opitutaceae bacterium]
MKPPSTPFAALDQPTPPPDKAASWRLYQFGRGSLILLAVFFIWSNGFVIDTLMLLGLGILILASLPVLNWAKHRRTWFPAFEVAMLTCIPFYALPLLSRENEVRSYPEESVILSGIAVLIYLVCAHAGFAFVRHPKKPARWTVTSLIPVQSYRFVPIGLLLNTVYLYIITFTDLIPGEFSGTLRALFFGVGTLSTFILSRLLGLGMLRSGQIWFFIGNLAAQIVFLFSQLYLINGISLVALALIAYSASRRRVPWLILVVFTPIVALLHLGKSDMRSLYWEAERKPPTLTELPAYFSEWIGYSLETSRERDEGLVTQSTIFERASLIQMLCLCTEQVPNYHPFLWGESYIDLPAQVIPRFLWPGKPSSLMANVRLGIYFGLIDPDDPYSVSIAFGMIAESFVNFGLAGVGLLGFLAGALFKRISLWAQDVPQFSALGILMILLTAWSFQAELVLATWLTSLFQASLVCIGLPLAYRHFSSR